MEIYSVTTTYNGARACDDYTSSTLYSSLQSATKHLQSERKAIFNDNPWLKNEDCIVSDTDKYFCVSDTDESYEVVISKETVHD